MNNLNALTRHAARSTHYKPSISNPQLLKFILLLAIAILAAACAPRPAPASPQPLYVFDVQNLHVDHAALCGAPCPPDTPPPDEKSFADLLNDYDTLIFLSSLQGIVNRDAPRLYLIHHPTDQFWLDTYRTPNENYGWLAETSIITLPTFEAVLDTFAPEIEGLVAWDDAVPATLNVATTIAGVEGVPIVRAGSSLAQKLAARWHTKISLAGKFTDDVAAYRWAMAEYLRNGRTDPTLLAYLEDGTPAQKYRRGEMTRGGVYALERDYVVQRGGFAFDLSPWKDDAPVRAELLTEIVQTARAEAGLRLIKVWGFIPWYEKYTPETGGTHSAVDGEWESTWLFSYYAGYLQGGGGDAWGAALANVSVHRFAPKPSPVNAPSAPTPAELREKDFLRADGSLNPELTFVLLYAGDYDLVHPTLVALADWPRSTWQDDARGDIPLAWGINPGMEEEIPGVMSYLLATRTPNDFLVGANSGAGYVNPQGISRRFRWQWLRRTKNYYRKYGITVQGFLLNGRGYSLPPEWVARYAKLAPDGIIAPDFEIEGDAPRLVNGTPYLGMQNATFGDSVPASAAALHQAYFDTLATGKPPFIAVRSAFQTPSFLKGVINFAQTQDSTGDIIAPDGAVVHPRYTVVDPQTFFALLKVALRD